VGEPVRSGVELTTISLICPLWRQAVEVTVISDQGGFVGAAGCPLSEPGTGCLAPCEAEMRRWLEYAGPGR
jgi:hypothetical protein